MASAQSFPCKLHQLLENNETDSSIISWVPEGDAFKIHKPDELCETFMKTYFKQTKLKSFTRQLYIYGFSKIPKGPNAGGFFHPSFVRNNKDDVLLMRRNKSGDRRYKETRIRQPALPNTSYSSGMKKDCATPIKCSSSVSKHLAYELDKCVDTFSAALAASTHSRMLVESLRSSMPLTFCHTPKSVIDVVLHDFEPISLADITSDLFSDILES